MSTDLNTVVPTLRTLRGEITLNAALEEEQDMLRRLSYWDKRIGFFVYLLDHTAEIEAVVSYHLCLSEKRSCRLAPLNDWVHGSFNICIPVHVNRRRNHPEMRLMIRFPLPYKLGEEECPGNAEEKLRCEAASYIWVQKNCPDIPIPRLRDFAFQDNQCGLTPGYLLVDYIEEDEGVMLSETWEEKRQDKSRRANLFRGLSRIILSLDRIPLARIGSFTLDNTGVLSLTNRPLTLRLQDLENGGIPVDITRGNTYTAIEPYILDFLAYHDSRLRHQPNSINDEVDGREQMAAMTGMRAVLHHFIDHDLRHGPFLFTLTDIHQSSIFVDEQWNIKRLIDLE
ncbi:MAG: hypothetical protein Q9167_007260 [Letrouitia subvulpina]